MSDYDVIVIGAGPGGYVAALRCAQLGLNTACIESWIGKDNKPSLGGTCLNVGCIPSKALLDSSHHYSFMQQHASQHGINFSGISIDVHRMMKRKNDVVRSLTQGINGLFKKNKIRWIKGHASLNADLSITVAAPHETHEEECTLTAENIIIATGSVPAELSVATVDQHLIVDSTGALSFDSVPRHLGIIGAGVIGLELGSVWRRLGSKVTVLEAMDQFLPSVDQQIANMAKKTLCEQGLEIKLGASVTGTGSNGQVVSVTYRCNDETERLDVDKLVVAVGRRPNTKGLNAKAAGLKLDARGFIVVDENCLTNLPGVYAIGDVVRGPMLAHKASEEGVAVAERIAGHLGHCELDYIPWVIYTWPEIAWAGRTEEELKASGIPYRCGTFPFLASGRAHASGETGGMVKILSEEKNDNLLGIHIIGANASELIAEAVLAIAFEGSSEDLARTIHAHPTLAEAMHEAALSVDQRTLHY